LAKEGKILSNHFNVYSIIKIIFKKRGEEFVGRFDPEFSLASLNPLTNNRIIGEVEFFYIENPYLKVFPVDSRYPPNQTLSIKGIKGTFIGSDYNFIYSEILR
jgi:hypothetical protein